MRRTRTRVELLWDEDEPRVFIGGEGLDIEDVQGESVFAQCTLEDLGRCQTDGFPAGLVLHVRDQRGFNTRLFHELVVRQGRSSGAEVTFICLHPNKYWEGHWGLSTLLQKMAQLAPATSLFEVAACELEDDWKRLDLRVQLPSGSFKDGIAQYGVSLQELIRAAEAALAGFVWKRAYETDEKLFCNEVLSPLLRKMGFLEVQYSGGPNEFGRDYTFSEMTMFGFLRHYGLQAKAGDVSGGNNSQIDDILGQLEDAFSMPYVAINSGEKRYISTFVIAISGRYTSNAKQKIVDKMKRGLVGSVYFLDQEKICELIERHWTR